MSEPSAPIGLDGFHGVANCTSAAITKAFGELLEEILQSPELKNVDPMVIANEMREGMNHPALSAERIANHIRSRRP